MPRTGRSGRPGGEQYLGRPFAGHRDAVAEMVGDEMERAIEGRLRRAGIADRQTPRAERIPGFGQAPDFCIPIDGRGFRERREDMRQLLPALDGKLFTTATLDRLIPHTRLRTFVSSAPSGAEIRLSG